MQILPDFSALLLGVLTWTLAEYVLHRFLGHDKRTWPNAFATEHTRHHSVGDYFAPKYKKGLAAIAVLALMLPIAVAVVGIRTGIEYTAAFVAMYLCYEWMHYGAHVHPGRGRYARFRRRHHFYHHFGNPKTNHGVTSPLWDAVFGTIAPSDRVRVPEKLAMVWLVDPATGEVRAEFAQAYTLVRKANVN